ncbi:hypothetical protein [Marichromatium gracile]|uniref:Zinc-binding alcohol dehydrogenase family protein n=1 Tax=Marichromatium gracile TaxID=1048 RepID=A0A4R4ABI9_MARGR|nr:hypothetical protein [Marichromatium gracile]TCW36388.1 hypothetical protein EDC29_104176 [Marichromatium gracile]
MSAGRAAECGGDLVDIGYIERDEIRPWVAAAFDLAQLREAQRAFLDKQHVGRIVIRVAHPEIAR